MCRKKSLPALFFLISACLFLQPFPLQAEKAASNSSLFLGVLLRLEQARDSAISHINRAESTIAAARSIIERSRQEHNAKAEQIANRALCLSIETKQKARAQKARAEAAIARVRALAAAQNIANRADGIVTSYTGPVDYFSKRLNRVMPLDDKRAGLLEPGDEILTHDNGLAELKFLGGRADLVVGANSRIRMVEDKAGHQVIDMLRGKIYVGLAKLDEYKKMMNEKIAAYRNDAATVKDGVIEKLVNQYDEIKDRYEKVKSGQYSMTSPLGILTGKGLVRTPTAVLAVRGTKFLVMADENTGTDVVVLEGTVEVEASKGRAHTSVQTGYSAHVSPDGGITPPAQTDISKLEKWWPDNM